MFGYGAASIKGARFICIICIQHESSSGESVLQSFCRQPVLTCCSHLKHVETTCEWIYKLGCCQNRAFFCGLFWVISHTHPHTQSTYIVLLWGLVPPFCWTLEGTWVNILFLFCFFHITIYLWIDHSWSMWVSISSYWCMEFHGCPPIFPSFLAGLPCFISFLQRSWSPLKSWVFPLHPGAKQRIRCGSPKFFFGVGGGNPDLWQF